MGWIQRFVLFVRINLSVQCHAFFVRHSVSVYHLLQVRFECIDQVRAEMLQILDCPHV